MSAIQFHLSRTVNPPPQQLQQSFYEKIAQIFQINLDTCTSCEAQQQHCFSTILDQKNWLEIAADHRTYLEQLTDTQGRSILLHALQTGERKIAKELIKKDLFIDTVDGEGNTPLHIACSKGNLKLIDLLLMRIETNIANIDGQTPLHTAIGAGQLEVVVKLLDEGANTDASFTHETIEVTPLSYAVKCGKLEIVKEFINRDVSLDSAKTSLGNILHLSVHFHQKDILSYLIKNCTDDCKSLLEKHNNDEECLTPIAYAVKVNNGPALILLHTFGGNIEAEDSEGRRPLHIAAQQQNRLLIEALYYLGCQLSPTDIYQQRPLDLIPLSDESAELTKNFLANLVLFEKDRDRFPPNFSVDSPENIVFKGGGPKGIAYLGALKALENENALFKLKRVAGTSAGAINSALLAFNFPFNEMLELLAQTNLKSFLDPRDDVDPRLQKDLKKLLENPLDNKALLSFGRGQLQITSAIGAFIERKPKMKILEALLSPIWYTKGLCKGEALRNWIEKTLSEKIGINHCTFKELRTLIQQGKPYKHLHIFAIKVDVPQKIVQFNSEDEEFDDFIISDAAVASASIPCVFVPHIMHKKNNNGERIACPDFGHFIDGGLLYNLPVEAFDKKKYTIQGLPKQEAICPIFNKRTLGFSLYSPEKNEPSDTPPLETIIDLAKALMSVYKEAENLLRQMNPYNQNRVIEIDNQGVKLLEFDLSPEKKEKLVKSGLECTSAFFAKQIKTNKASLFRIPRIHKEIQHQIFLKEIHPHYVPRRALLIEMEKALLNNRDAKYVLYGPGGVGKSELAIAFANTHLDKFSLVWFISCRTEDEIIKGYRSLADALTVDIDENDDRNEIIGKVHEKLEQNTEEPWLLIFDDLNPSQGSDENLMPHSFPACGGVSLITAYAKIPDLEGLGVGTLTKKEGLELLEKVMEPESPDIPVLLEQTGCYALRLGQVAAAYLTNEQIDVQVELEERYQKTLEEALNLTLENLKGKTKEWLEICVQLNPARIPLSYLETYLTYNPSEGEQSPFPDEIKMVLINFALIQFDQETNCFSMQLELKKEILHLLQPSMEETVDLLIQMKKGWDFENTEDWKKTMEEASIWTSHALELVGRESWEEVAEDQQASILTGIGIWREKSTLYQEAKECHEKALNIREKLFGNKSAEVASSLSHLGTCYFAQKRYDMALEKYKKAYKNRKELFNENSTDMPRSFIAESLSDIGSCYLLLGEYGKAKRAHREALKIIDEEFHGEHPVAATTLNNIGFYYCSNGKYDDALKKHLEAIKIWEKLFGCNHPNVATSLNEIGYCYYSKGKYDDALEKHLEALTIRVKLFGYSHPDVAASFNNMAFCYYSKGKYDDALIHYHSAFTTRKKVFGSEHRLIGDTLSDIGSCYYSQKKYENALEKHLEVLEIRRRVFGNAHREVATSLNNVGNCYYSQKKYENALEKHLEALGIRRRVFGNAHLEVATSLSNVGNCYDALWKYDDALKMHAKALAIRKNMLGDKHPHTKLSLLNCQNCKERIQDEERRKACGLQ